MRLRIYLPLVAACAAMPAVATAQATPAQREDVHAAYIAGDFDRAQRLLMDLLDETPEDADLLRRLAAVQAAQGDNDAAQVTIDLATRIAPHDLDIRLARANILLWRGRLSEAQALAEQMATAHPDYPGLERLVHTLRQARQVRKLRLRDIGVGISASDAQFASGQDQTWYVQRGSISATWDGGNIASIDVEREERQATDTRISGRIAVPAGSHWYFVSASVSPDPDFRENWSLGAGADLSLSARSSLEIDGRFSEYRSDDVLSVGLGLRHGLSSRLEVTARSIHLFGGGEDYRLGGALRADYRHPQLPEIFAIVASYPDTEADGTRQLRTIAAGTRLDLPGRLSLGVTGEFEAREGGYERTTLAVDLRWRFAE